MTTPEIFWLCALVTALGFFIGLQTGRYQESVLSERRWMDLFSIYKNDNRDKMKMIDGLNTEVNILRLQARSRDVTVIPAEKE